MRQRILWPWIVGFAFAVAGASMNCGGDDDNGTGGTAGSTGGKGGTAGSAGSTMSAGGKGGSGGNGGTAGSGGGGTAGKGGGGSGGTAGSAGSAGNGGGGAKADAGDSGPDAPTDSSNPETSTADVRTDAATEAATDAAPDTTTADRPDGSVAFAAVTEIFTRRCITCHNVASATARIDLITPVGLYTRLTSPLPDNQEGKCGFPTVDGGDAGDDGGGDAAVMPNRTPIVPGDTSASLLYRKVAGTQPAGCGQRMPRIPQFNDDGGAAGSVACDLADGGAANCLSQADLDTIGNWITQGAPNN
jgi:hypothetical protein